MDELMTAVQGGILEKRDSLDQWLKSTSPDRRADTLGTLSEGAVLEQIDTLEAAAGEAESGKLGLCTVCHERVDDHLLAGDYTSCICISHMSPEEARSLEMQLELAQSVQRSLLPQHGPETDALDTAAFSRPAQIVGGDYFDFFRFKGGAQGLAVADVAGHGISASLRMASVQTLLRTLIPGSDSPADIMAQIHRLLVHNIRFSTFVTLFLGAIDTSTGTMKYANAGHPPPLMISGDGSPEQWLRGTGPALGMLDDSVFREQEVRVPPGSLLVLYTDGITEATDDSGEEFGRGRLLKSIIRHRNERTSALVKEFRRELSGYTGSTPLADDATMVACRYLG